MQRNFRTTELITIYAEHITTRLHYVLDFCFRQKGQEYIVLSLEEDWQKSTHQHINYSNKDLNSEIQIHPQGILFESEINFVKDLDYTNQLELDGVPDTFGIIFYLLTSYEEYFLTDVDKHGRFQSKDNPLVKLGLHQQPVIDLLVKEIWLKLGLDYKSIQADYKLIPSFDIDVAWAYKNRNFPRAAGGFLKGTKILDRLKVLSNIQQDPYDTFDIIKEIAQNNDQTKFFVLLGDWGKFDKNIHWENKKYQALIRSLNEVGEVGIHPSYGSYLNADKVGEEKKRLKLITGKSVQISRQHFLKMKLPESYQILLNNNITTDYSMGFADNIGFRAGTSFTFHFFDLILNEQTDLMITPFAYMDSALKDYLLLSPQKSIEIIEKMKHEVENVGGNFNFIWHNSSIHDQNEWNGWKHVLLQTLN